MTKLHNPDEKNRRCRLVKFEEDELLTVLRWCANPVGRLYVEAPQEALPEDVELLGAWHDAISRSLLLRVSHPSFDYVEPMTEPPTIRTAHLVIEGTPEG